MGDPYQCSPFCGSLSPMCQFCMHPIPELGLKSDFGFSTTEQSNSIGFKYHLEEDLAHGLPPFVSHL